MEQNPILRKKEIEDLKKLFNNNEIIFIKGVSGVGKTTLIENALNIRYHSIKIHLYKDFTLSQHLEKSKNIIMKENSKLGVFHKIKNIVFFKKFNFKWLFGFSLFREQSIDYYRLILKNKNNGVKLTNNDNIDLDLSISNLNLNKKNSPIYFKRYFSLAKYNIDCLIFENTELIVNEDLLHLQNLLLEKPKSFKIIFEIGELKSTNIYLKLVPLLKNRDIVFNDYEIKNFDFKKSKEFYNFYKEERNLTSFDYNKNDGIPLLILLFGGAFIQDKHDFTESLKKHKNFSDNLYLLLAIFYGLKIDENTFLKYANKYNVSVENLNTFKNSNLIKLDEGLMTFSHPLIQQFILDTKYDKLKIFIEGIFEENLQKDFEYFYIKLKFVKRYNLKLNPDDIKLLISHLCDKLEDFNLQPIVSLLSYKKEFFSELSLPVQNIINLIELQIKIYNFRLEEYDDNKFDIKTKIITNLLKFQYQDHKNYFEETEEEINLFKKNLREDLNYINILDKDLVEYISIILNGILISVKRALSNYDEAKEYWIEAIQCSKNNQDYKNIYDYLMNMYPFVFGIKETYEEHSSDFFETAFIKNKYIKAKRMHNISAVNLYYKYNKYDYMKEQFNLTIEYLKNVSPLETSYTFNNLLVLYIINKKIYEAEQIIKNIDKYFFETYDLISFYNNAIVLGIIKKDFNYSLKFYEKAKKLNFQDKSFDSKIHYNMGLFYKIRNEYDKMESCFNKMSIDINYDKGLIENKKNYIRNNSIDEFFFFQKNQNDIREQYIYWVQIIHFWDFDIPILNKKIIEYLLKN